MSQEVVECLIGKIVLNTRFREALLADPEQTLSEFELTEVEKINFKRLDSETLEALADTFATRTAKIYSGFQNVFLNPEK